MRSVDEIVGDLEADRLSREGELRLVERLSMESTSDNEKNMLRRSLVLLTYSHLEGFCRFAISTYVSALNSMCIRCDAASAPVAAAGMTDVFKALRDTNNKHALFGKSLGDDRVVHMAAREQVFVENTRQFFDQIVNIPDALVETHYSLSTDVIRKLMFQVGLKMDGLETRRSSIEKLKHIRNLIAHGDRLKVPTTPDATAFIDAAREVMSFLQREITFALNHETYKRTPGTALAEAG